MTWNWQRPDWPRFAWEAARLERAEERFVHGAGVMLGTVSHLDDSDRERITVEALCAEAVTTSRIEGEVLDRASVQSSVRRALGLATDRRGVRPAEQGISEMMVDLYRSCAGPLSDATMFAWHTMVMRGARGVRDIGRYRTHAEPMRVVSGRAEKPRIHFEAPPSTAVAAEMSRFVDWFNRTAPEGADPLPTLTRAGIAHIYFESVHPFEDGNGRIGRALAEKALAQGLRRPTLTALASTILAHRRAYYDALEAANKGNQITDWLAWFAAITLEAQQRTLAEVEFLIDKARLLERVKSDINERQLGVLLRVLAEGPTGFVGGLSAGKYATIARTSSATATRDLSHMLDLGALIRTGARRHARYAVNVPARPVSTFVITESGEVVTSPTDRPHRENA